jgi:hypothetical protein
MEDSTHREILSAWAISTNALAFPTRYGSLHRQSILRPLLPHHHRHRVISASKGGTRHIALGRKPYLFVLASWKSARVIVLGQVDRFDLLQPPGQTTRTTYCFLAMYLTAMRNLKTRGLLSRQLHARTLGRIMIRTCGLYDG